MEDLGADYRFPGKHAQIMTLRPLTKRERLFASRISDDPIRGLASLRKMSLGDDSFKPTFSGRGKMVLLASHKFEDLGGDVTVKPPKSERLLERGNAASAVFPSSTVAENTTGHAT